MHLSGLVVRPTPIAGGVAIMGTIMADSVAAVPPPQSIPTKIGCWPLVLVCAKQLAAGATGRVPRTNGVVGFVGVVVQRNPKDLTVT